MTTVYISEQAIEFNFEFKDGSKTDKPALKDGLERTVIDPYGNQIKRIVKWYSKKEGYVSRGL
jgi:hypothetical protein